MAWWVSVQWWGDDRQVSQSGKPLCTGPSLWAVPKLARGLCPLEPRHVNGVSIPAKCPPDIPTEHLLIQVNKSSVQAVDEAYRKQKEAEKQLQSLKYQAEQNRKIAEKEVQKLKKRIKLQSEKINEIKFFCGIGYIVAFVLSACLVKMCFL